MFTDDAESVVTEVRAALVRRGLDLRRYPVELQYEDGVLMMAGELPNVAAKKRALEDGAASHGVRWVEDRLRVEPSTRMADREILDHVRNALISEVEFEACAIRVLREGAVVEIARDPVAPRGSFEISADNGVVRLDGTVPSHSHKRLAGVLCWWVPGTCDVVNALEIEPPEEDSDDEITDAVHLAMERDPLVDASIIGIRTDHACVTLTGILPSQEQRDAAECDAWYVFGVGDVINQIDDVMP